MPRSKSPKRRSKSCRRRSKSPSKRRSRSRSPSKKRKRSRSWSKKRIVERILYISFCAKNDNIKNLRKLEKKLLKRSGITLDGHDYGKDGACVFLNVKNKGYNIFAVNNISQKYKIKMHISNE